MTMADGPIRRPSRSPRAQGLCKVTVLVPEDCADDVRQFAQQLRDRQPNGRVPETPKWRVISPSAELMGAGLGVHGPNATAACVRDQDVDPTPSLDDPNNHQRYRLVVGHVDLDTQSGAVRCLNLDHSKRSNTVA